MPNAAADYKPWRVLDLIVKRLQTIIKAAGYNCQPRVTTDPRVAMSEPGVSLLLVAPGDIETSDMRPGGAWRMTSTINVYGQQPIGSGDPWQECYALMQDTTYCLTNYFSSLATALGTGGAIDIGTMTASLVVLDASDVTIFHVPITVAWQTKASEV